MSLAPSEKKHSAFSKEFEKYESSAASQTLH